MAERSSPRRRKSSRTSPRLAKTPERRQSTTSDVLRRRALTSSAHKSEREQTRARITPRSMITEYLSSQQTAEPVTRQKRHASPAHSTRRKKPRVEDVIEEETPRTIMGRFLSEVDTQTPVVRQLRRRRSEEDRQQISTFVDHQKSRRSESFLEDDEEENIVPDSQPVQRTAEKKRRTRPIKSSFVADQVEELERTARSDNMSVASRSHLDRKGLSQFGSQLGRIIQDSESPSPKSTSHRSEIESEDLVSSPQAKRASKSREYLEEIVEDQLEGSLVNENGISLVDHDISASSIPANKAWVSGVDYIPSSDVSEDGSGERVDMRSPIIPNLTPNKLIERRRTTADIMMPKARAPVMAGNMSERKSRMAGQSEPLQVTRRESRSTIPKPRELDASVEREQRSLSVMAKQRSFREEHPEMAANTARLSNAFEPVPFSRRVSRESRSTIPLQREMDMDFDRVQRSFSVAAKQSFREEQALNASRLSRLNESRHSSVRQSPVAYARQSMSSTRGPSPRGLDMGGPSPRGQSFREPSPRSQSFRGPSPRSQSFRGPSPRSLSTRGPSPRSQSFRGPSPRGPQTREPSPRGLSPTRISPMRPSRLQHAIPEDGEPDPMPPPRTPLLIDRPTEPVVVGKTKTDLYDFFSTMERRQAKHTAQATKKKTPPKVTRTVANKPKNAPRAKRTKPKKKEIGMTTASMREMFKHFCRFPVSNSAFAEIEALCEQFWENSASDLSAFAAHAGRQYVNIDDLLLLMKRQRFITDDEPLDLLVEKFLPLEYREKIIPMAISGNKLTGTALSKTNKRKGQKKVVVKSESEDSESD